MDTPNEVTISNTVIDPLVSVLQGYGLEDEFENKITKILEKLGSEMAEVKFIPSPDLVSLVEELLDSVEEEQWEEDDEDDDDIVIPPENEEDVSI